jgi:hypothetical protein
VLSSNSFDRLERVRREHKASATFAAEIGAVSTQMK